MFLTALDEIEHTKHTTADMTSVQSSSVRSRAQRIMNECDMERQMSLGMRLRTDSLPANGSSESKKEPQSIARGEARASIGDGSELPTGERSRACNDSMACWVGLSYKWP
jgi:hypothetical protein